MNTGSIKIFGKNVISTFNHNIMSLTYSAQNTPRNVLRMECVNDHPEKMIDGTYSVETAKKVLSNNRGKCEVFVYYDSEEKPIGTLSVMYRGGNDIEYKIRNIDAFIYNVLTKEEFRGRGYAGEMLFLLSEYLHRKSIDKVYLAVSKNNNSAVRAYIKTGFVTENNVSFIRILRLNVPYKWL